MENAERRLCWLEQRKRKREAHAMNSGVLLEAEQCVRRSDLVHM